VHPARRARSTTFDRLSPHGHTNGLSLSSTPLVSVCRFSSSSTELNCYPLLCLWLIRQRIKRMLSCLVSHFVVQPATIISHQHRRLTILILLVYYCDNKEYNTITHADIYKYITRTLVQRVCARVCVSNWVSQKINTKIIWDRTPLAMPRDDVHVLVASWLWWSAS